MTGSQQMPEHVSASTSERPRSRKLIEDMLQQRQQMLVLLWELSKLDFAKVDQNIRETLEEFQEILVDYIATGHFGLYQRISEGTERRQSVLETAREIYPRIAKTTDVAVEFTDKYEALDAPVIEARLTTDLSTLAEEIATRIELEDRLILAMLGTEYIIPAQGSAA
ncbi:MAG: Rsd/AlgQ family anti-sigma factor [Proteobacteria bacterium]|nr:Rsd/AlgQ family anti-sigma factor [Pseudomonadota bacterium]